MGFDGDRHGETSSRLRFLESILENVSDAVIVTGAVPLDEPGPQVVYVNAAFSSMTGYSPEDIIGRAPRILQGPKTDRAKLDLVRESLEEGRAVKVEVLNYRKDGSEFWVEMDIVPVPGESGWPTLWVSVQRDTTARRESEERLRDVQKTLRAVLAHHESEMITILEPDGTLRYESPVVKKVLGDGSAPVGNGEVSGRIHPDDEEGFSEALRSVLQTPGRTPLAEYRVLCADGAWRWFESVANNLTGDPDVGGIVLTSRDVSARKEAENRLRDAEARYRSLVERIPAVTYIDVSDASRPSGYETLYVSPQISRMLGYSPEEFIEDPSLWPSLLHPEDRERALETDARHYESGEAISHEYRMISRDGRVIWVRDEAVKLRSETDGRRFSHGFLIDVTRRKEAEEKLREAEERYRTLVERVPGVTYVEDAETGATHYDSPQIEEILGYPPDISRRDPHYWWKVVHPEDVEWVREEERRAEARGKFSMEYRVLAKDGRVVWLRDEAAIMRDDPGEGGFWRGFLFDITERKRAEEALEESEARLKSVTSGAPVILFALDREGRITLSEGKGLDSLGLQPGEGVGHSVFEAYDGLPEVCANIRRALAGEEVAATVKVRELAFDARYSPVRNADGEVSGVIGVATDITEHRKLEQELQYLAFHDSLTGLANRALLMDRLSQSLGRAGRRASPVAVLFMDLDDFKVVNDSLGHDAGDELLIEVAGRLRRCLRPGDTLARLGGDEFVMLLEDAGLDGALRVAGRVENALDAPFFLGAKGHERFVTASVGITVGASEERSPEDLLREADLAMYRAKEEGKGRCEVFDSEMSARVLGRLEMEENLRRALELGQLELHYQPLVSLETGRVVGLEALVRWRHPERGLVYPGDFIELAEETGLIIPLGAWVLEESCRRLAEWREALAESEPVFLCVNLSARQFRQPSLARDVAGILERTGVPPESLYLEVTESVAMARSHETGALEELKRLGVGIMIDDFGAGRSSLSYLKKLPADCIKIDRAFAAELAGDLVDREIIAAIVRLGHAMDLKIVAEGVESAEQLLRLRELGCDYAQGYFFSEPLRVEEISNLLRTASLW